MEITGQWSMVAPKMQEHAQNTTRQAQPPNRGIDTCGRRALAARTGKIGMTCDGKAHHPGVTIPNDTLPGLNSIGFWDSTRAQDWRLNAHRNEGVAIHFVETGSMAFMADGRRFNLRPGDLAIARPWQLHKLGDPYIGPGRVHWLNINVGISRPDDQWQWPPWVTLTPRDLAELTHRLQHNKMPVSKSTTEIARIFQQIGRCVAQWRTPHSVSRMIANLNQLLVSLLDTPATPKLIESSGRGSSGRVVELFLKDLETNQKNCQEFKTLEQMAGHCGLGITSFAQYTRQFVNVGAMEFLKQCRLNHAARQLREHPGTSITDVCFSNGFNSSQYFATCFRRQFKMSPRKFVSKQRPGVVA
jgi:AraC-like DNA-binding protein